MSVIMSTSGELPAGPITSVAGSELADEEAISGLDALDSYLDRVQDCVEVGIVELARTVPVGPGRPMPLALIVGGWPAAAHPCGCKLTDRPAIPSLSLSVRLGASAWRCDDCGLVIEPTIWATMPLRTEVDSTGRVGWLVPNARQLAETCDRAWRDWSTEVTERGRVAAWDLESQLHDLLDAPAAAVEGLRAKIDPAFMLFMEPPEKPLTRASLRWEDPADQTSGALAVGHYGPRANPQDRTPGETLHLPFTVTGHVTVTAATATRLWNSANRDVAGTEPSPERLTEAWTDCLNRPPPTWLTPTAAAELAAIHTELTDVARHRSRPSRGLGR